MSPGDTEGGPATTDLTAPATIHAVEIVHMALYDIGRSIDLRQATDLLPGTPGMRIMRRRDTPESVMIPDPLCIDLRSGKQKAFTDESVEGFAATARLYDDGVMSIIIRLRVSSTLEDLHGVEHRRLSTGIQDLDTYADERYRAVLELVEPAVSKDHYDETRMERESYTAYCFADVGCSPSDFAVRNERDLTTLMTGEPYGALLHPSQIRRTMSNPFSYSENDVAIFDMDRCIIIDSERDYEDVLLICELANYQFLELRTLDRLLDRWLDEAEDDVRLFQHKGGKRRQRGTPLEKKFTGLQALRLDALFILENLENSAKIIGDYFLGSVYEHLCGIFNTAGWNRSVERRLDALQNIYEIVKGDKTERTMLFLEVVFIVVCILFPVIQILQVMLTS
ncbi:MAG: hypothetical protein ABIJ86_04645 [Spirochaetota bacterium]